MKKSELKKEIASILDNAQPVAGKIYVTERINEYGFNCTYRFSEDMRDELLKRSGQNIRKSSPVKSWEYTQKALLFLERKSYTNIIRY